MRKWTNVVGKANLAAGHAAAQNSADTPVYGATKPRASGLNRIVPAPIAHEGQDCLSSTHAALFVDGHLVDCVDVIPLLYLCMYPTQPSGLCELLCSYALLYGALHLAGCLIEPVHLRKVLQPAHTKLQQQSRQRSHALHLAHLLFGQIQGQLHQRPSLSSPGCVIKGFPG